MSQIDTFFFFFFFFFFFTYCIMMVVKVAATTAIVNYVSVKFYYLTYGEHKQS